MAGQEIASFYATIGADVKDFKKGLGNVKDDMSSLDKTTVALGKALSAAFAVGVAGAVAFTAVISKSVKAAADMEQGVADIGAMMSLTDEDTQKLGDHIMDLGLDPKLKVSATEASAAIMALGTAGLSTSEILGGASEATVLLANATGLKGSAGLAAAASIATDVMAQFNIKASEMDAAVSAIAGTTVASKFTIDDYRLAIAQAGGVSGSVGLDFNEFNAIIAATSSSFASGSDAGTSLGTMLSRLVPTTKDAQAAMDELGLRTADGSSKFFDAAGNMKSAEEIAGLLQTAFGGLSDAQKIEAATTIFGTDARRTALALAKGGTAIIAEMKSTIGNVNAEELAAKRMDTFSGSMEIAMGIVETISISIGQKFLPVLRPLVDKFSELAQTYGPMVIAFFAKVAEKMAEWSKEIFKLSDGTGTLWERLGKVSENLTKVYNIIVIALKPITDIISEFVTWKDVMTALGLLLGGMVLGAIGAVVHALWPVITTIAAVVAAVAALRWAWQNDFGGIQTDTKRILDNISRWFFEESGLWKGSWAETFEYFAWWVEWGWKKDIYFPLRSRLIELRNDFALWALMTKNGIIKWVDDTKNTLNDWKNKAIDKVGDFKNITITAFEHWKNEAERKIDYFVGRAHTLFILWRNRAVAIAKEWRDDFLEKVQGLIDWWDRHINPWVQRGRDLVQGIWDGMKEIWRKVKQWWDDIWSNDVPKTIDVKMKMDSPSKVMEEYGKWTMQGFAIGAKDAMPLVEGAMGGLSHAAMGAGQSAAQNGVSTSRIEELLTILIAELRAKNMTANVTVAGGGGSYGSLVTHAAGMR